VSEGVVLNETMSRSNIFVCSYIGDYTHWSIHGADSMSSLRWFKVPHQSSVLTMSRSWKA